MRQVRLGRTQIDMSALGLGCSRIGSTSMAMTHDRQQALLEGAYAAGVNLFDTSNIYGQGDSEKLLGAVFGSRRGKVVIMTKAGQRYNRSQKVTILFKKPLRLLAKRIPALQAIIAKRRAEPLPRCFEPDYLRKELTGSLTRLRTSYVDVFFLHSPAIDDLGDERLASMMAALKDEGRVRSWGVSCDGEVRIDALLAKIEPEVLQIPLKTVDSFDNRAALRQFKARGGAVVVREVLADGSGLHAPSVPTKPTVRAKWTAVARDDCVTAALCGTSSLDHLRDAASALSGHECLPGFESLS